jgi:hypothetical protein
MPAMARLSSTYCYGDLIGGKFMYGSDRPTYGVSIEQSVIVQPKVIIKFLKEDGLFLEGKWWCPLSDQHKLENLQKKKSIQ